MDCVILTIHGNKTKKINIRFYSNFSRLPVNVEHLIELMNL